MDSELVPHRHGSKTAIAITGMVLLAAVVGLAILRDRFVNRPEYQVSFTGQGKVSYQPDVANVSLGVQVDKSPKAEDALKGLNDTIAKVVKAVEEAGIPRADIKTENYSLYPQYDTVEGVNKPAGYSANQLVTIKVRDIVKDADKVTKVIAAATKAGINQVNGVTFEPADLAALKQEAREKAIVDAKAKADKLAPMIGVRTDEVVGWWENYMDPMINYGYGGMGGGAEGKGGGNAVVPAGTQEVTVEVTINYKLK